MNKKWFKFLTGAFALIIFTYVLSNAGSTDVRKKSNTNTLEIKQNTSQKFSFTNYFTNYSHNIRNTPEGLFEEIKVDEYGKTNLIGYPELPVNVQIIEVPLGADIKINIVSSNYIEHKLKDLDINHPIFPHQPPIPKSEIYSPFEKCDKVYKTNNFYPYEIAWHEELGIMRGVRLVRLFVAPLQYNAAKGIIRIHSEIEVEVSFKHPDISKSNSLKKSTQSLYFDPFYKNILNYKSNISKDTIVKYPVKYVIVSDPMFQSQLQDFISWKTKKGFTVIEAYTDDPAVGASVDSIKDYLENLYFSATPTDPAPSFVLLVGDYAQIPAKNGLTGFQITDLYYAEYTGDFLPEVFIGRFSATNFDQLQPQLDKTLEYEQYLFPDPSFLDKAVLIAGVDGTHGPVEGNGQLNYISDYYIKPSNGFLPYYYPYPASGSQGANIIQNVSNGVGFVNYTAHGNVMGWQNPSFTISNVATLTNNQKYPLMIGNACGTCNFGYNICFGEALLRAENAGAIGYIGASSDSYWSEDYYWSVGVGAITANPTYAGTSLAAYDRTFHMYGEPESEWFVTQGQMIYAGNLAVTASGSSDWDYYWEVYHLLGDPSLMVYYTVPPPLSVSYPSMIPVGASSFTIITEPYAYVGISMNGVLHGAAPSDPNGIAVLSLTPFVQPGKADVVVTKQNRQPFIDTVSVAFPGGPFLILNNFEINDSNGNANGKVDFGETISLDVEIKNTGSSPANQTTATLTANDTNIVITKGTHNWGDIPAFDSIMQIGAFSFTVNDLIPDQHKVYFYLEIQDTTGNVFKEIISITLNAPDLMIGSYFVDDHISGNNNGRLDPGETADIIIPSFNNGHCNADSAIGVLLCNNSVINLVNTTYEFYVLFSNSSKNSVFTVNVSSQVPVATMVELNYTLSSGLFQTQKSFFPFIGQVSEDWESGDFSRYNWQHSGNKPWVITNIDPYEGLYSAKSGNIIDLEVSTLLISFEVSEDDSISFYRKVSSEEGYDFLRFYIDNDLQEEWSGIKEWERVCFPVNAGFHSFRWVYEKDFGTTIGDDCAWIDLINFPPVAGIAGFGEDQPDDRLSFKVFPNPAKDIVTFTFNSLNDCEGSLSVFDNNGRKIKEITDLKRSVDRQHKISINFHDFKAGVYYAVLRSCDKRETRKFLVIN